MELTVQGKQIDVGDALRTHVEEKLQDINQKYFNRAVDATVTFAPESTAFFKTHISLRINRDLLVQAYATEKDIYASFDQAADKLAKQLRRYKRRLRDHHQLRHGESAEGEVMKARAYTIALEDHAGDEDTEVQDGAMPAGDDPAIIAEISTEIRTLSVSDAVMHLDLSGETALLFRNPKHNGINMVYRRSDGNIGWVDPAHQKAVGD